MNLRGEWGERKKERLWTFLTKAFSGIPDPDIPSDWSILTFFVNTLASSILMRNAIWLRSETFNSSVRIGDQQRNRRLSKSGESTEGTRGLFEESGAQQRQPNSMAECLAFSRNTSCASN